MANAVVWVDIPVSDLDRATRFYSNVLGTKVEKHDIPNGEMGVLLHAENEVAGCLYKKAGDSPSAQGPIVYLNVSGRLDEAVAAAETNGGKVLRPRHAIGQYGFCAIVLDSEGNRIALHSGT